MLGLTTLVAFILSMASLPSFKQINPSTCYDINKDGVEDVVYCERESQYGIIDYLMWIDGKNIVEKGAKVYPRSYTVPETIIGF